MFFHEKCYARLEVRNIQHINHKTEKESRALSKWWIRLHNWKKNFWFSNWVMDRNFWGYFKMSSVCWTHFSGWTSVNPDPSLNKKDTLIIFKVSINRWETWGRWIELIFDPFMIRSDLILVSGSDAIFFKKRNKSWRKSFW